jgi:hypothetical protein
MIQPRIVAMVVLVSGLLIPSSVAQVQHGIIDVVELDGGNSPTSVQLTRIGGAGLWQIIVDDGINVSNRGDYTVDFLTGQDTIDGVLIVSPYESGRSEPSVTNDPYYATVATERNGNSNRYFISTHESPTGSEVNYNVSMAYFPLADGWLAGAAYNSSNNGPLNSLTGTPGLNLVDETSLSGSGFEMVDRTTSSGLYELNFEGLDLRRDGVLLACGAKNEDNRVAINLGTDGRATLNCIDNGAETGGENDPAAFVFIPEGTPDVIMGRVSGSGRKLFAQGNYNVSIETGTTGSNRLIIPGQNNTTGTLIVTPHTELGGATVDNVLFVIPMGNYWLIETRDIEPTSMNLQDIGAGDVLFHFAFFPNSGNPQPAVPPQDYARRLNDVVSARFDVIEFNGGNGLGDMRALRSIGSDALDVFGDNRGDVFISYLGARPAAYTNNGQDSLEGVMLGCPTEFFRSNALTGGVSGWSTFGFDNAAARTHVANGTSEMNSDFALAMFAATAGFQQGADISASLGVSQITIPGDAATDGVLIATNWDNNNRTVSARPVGNAFELRFFEGETGIAATSSTEYGYVYLPYDTPGLIAGQVAADGTILSGTGGFTTQLITHDSVPAIEIQIDGSASVFAGIMLLTPHENAIAMAWEPTASGDFAVGAYDLDSSSTRRVAFSFVYVPFETPCPNCPGDLNANCIVNATDALLLMDALDAQGETGDVNNDLLIDMGDLAAVQIAMVSDCDNLGIGPDEPTLVSPLHEAVTTTAPTLTVHVNDPNGGPMLVRYYGRELNNAPPFTIVTLPDTQNYSEKYPALFTAQTQWIVNNRDALDIAYVAHLGDIVQHADQVPEWINADASISIMDQLPDMPYGLTVGNHDQEPCCGGSPGGTANFNTFFPFTRYMGIVPWYGGHYGTKNDNSYYLFSASGLEFIAIHMEFDNSANQVVLDWADAVLKAYPNRRAIIVTHWMVGGGYPAAFSNQGRRIFEELSDNPNVFMLLGGHIAQEGRREDSVDGRPIYSILADYQSRTQGGDGWLRYYEFRPADNEIESITYSPTLDQFEYDSDSSFIMPYDMSGNDFELIGTVSGAANGSDVSVTWPNLMPGSRYEWYVVVQSPDGITVSDTWRFNVAD